MDRSQEQFKTDIYRRIQLAIAISIVKSTPKNKTPEAHATDLQQRLKIGWLDSGFSHGTDKSRLFADQLILTQQQSAISARLSAVIPQASNQWKDCSLEELNTSEIEDVGNATEQDKHQRHLDNIIAVRERLQTHTNFIQAIIQLKALAQLKTTIPTKQYVGAVLNILNRKRVLVTASIGTISEGDPEPFSSEDSGFYTNLEDCNTFPLSKEEKDMQHSTVTGVSSSMLSYIISSCNADKLVLKSMQAILHHIKDVVNQSDGICVVSNFNPAVDEWMGSVYHQALNILKSVLQGYGDSVGGNVATGQKFCCQLIHEIISDIIDENSAKQDTNDLRENQSLLVVQLCDNTSLWFDALHFLFCKISEFLKVICTLKSTLSKGSPKGPFLSSKKDMFQKLEQSYFLFILTRNLLERTRHHHTLMQERESENKPSNCNPPTTNKVSEQWRKRYSFAHHSSRTSSVNMKSPSHILSSTINVWKQSLETTFQEVNPECPLIAMILSECLWNISSANVLNI